MSAPTARRSTARPDQSDPGRLTTALAQEGQYGDFVLLSGIEVWSICEHHLLPFRLAVSIAYTPDTAALGLSEPVRHLEARTHALRRPEEALPVQPRRHLRHRRRDLPGQRRPRPGRLPHRPVDETAAMESTTPSTTCAAKGATCATTQPSPQSQQIATRTIERACRHLVNDRLDIAGAGWGLACAEPALKLRAEGRHRDAVTRSQPDRQHPSHLQRHR
ncbi:GTP cyclohydrolase I [Kitasatospora purpeofusca]|uniref:GTP cyclohydrolase I n=1 Tax=Kitasatospora purpeofusca TaxID=67352 RepID=UPI00099D6968